MACGHRAFSGKGRLRYQLPLPVYIAAPNKRHRVYAGALLVLLSARINKRLKVICNAGILCSYQFDKWCSKNEKHGIFYLLAAESFAPARKQIEGEL